MPCFHFGEPSCPHSDFSLWCAIAVLERLVLAIQIEEAASGKPAIALPATTAPGISVGTGGYDN